MRRILYLDASFERSFIAFDGQLLEVPSVQMADVISTLGSFDLVAAGAGPGSYTGMRVALALASGLSLAWQCPLVSLSVLYGFVPKQSGFFYAMLDARSGGVYYLKGYKGETITYEAVPSKAPSVSPLPLIISPRVAPLQGRFTESIQWVEAMPDPLRLLALVDEKFLAGDYSLTGERELLYLGKTA